VLSISCVCDLLLHIYKQLASGAAGSWHHGSLSSTRTDNVQAVPTLNLNP
jgi:hypothetical protein